MQEIENIQKNFLWNRTTPKIKHSTLCNSFSRIKQLYEDTFHEWKLIPLHLINITITPAFTFHLSLAFSFQLHQFPKFHQNIFQFWSTCFHAAYIFLFIILSEFLWFNRNIKLANGPRFSSAFLKRELISILIL